MSTAPDLSMFSKEEIRDSLQDIRHPVSIAVFGSDNYFNVGAIIRTCHVFLVREVILVDVPKFYEKATMGTHKWENITHTTLEEFCRAHHWSSSSDNRAVVSFERRPDLNTVELFGYKYPENPILCFGSEKTGLPAEVISLCQDNADAMGYQNIVSIPQFGLQNDMNLSNAVSIAVYDFLGKHYRK